MHRSLEALVRRDPNGLPLPPTQEEITRWSNEYGAKKVQDAVAEIQAAQAKARQEAGAASEQALKQEQARTALELAKTQAAAAKQQADVEAAARAQEVEKTRLANEKTAKKQQSDEGYRESGLGQTMSGLHAASPALGMAAGLGMAGKVIAPRQEASAQGLNTQRQGLGRDFDKINPQTATPSQYQSIADSAKQSNLVPKPGEMSKLARGVGRYAPYALIGGGMMGEGAYQRHLANSSPDMEPFSKDAWDTSGTGNMVAGASLIGKGALYSANPIERPDASSLRKIALAEQYAKEMADRGSPQSPQQGKLPPAETKQLPAPETPQLPHFAGPPKHQALEISRLLGNTPGEETKGKVIRDAMSAVEQADPDTLKHIASRIKDAGGATEPAEAIRGYLTRLAQSKPAMGVLGALGLGAAALGTPDEAEAASIMPGVKPEASSLNPTPSPVDRAMNIARRVPGAAADVMAPVASGAARELMAGPHPNFSAKNIGLSDRPADAASAQNEAKRQARVNAPPTEPHPGIAQAERQDARQRAEMEPQREPVGSEAARAQPSEVGPGIDRRVGKGTVGGEEQPSAFVNPEQHGFNPDHLPEHERGLIDNPHEAIERASWQLPYLATGRHMVGLTGDPDTFFGGKTPEHQQIYEDTLKANKAFYENAFKRMKSSPHSTPDQPVADEAPVAPEGFKHGGRVSSEQKKLGSIGDAFQKKLEDKQRVISSLEKALAKQPNAKLSAKLTKEKDEAKRIKEHLEKVHSFN